VLATEWGLGNVLWVMFAALFWIIAIWVFITVFADIFRRSDIGGAAKALWILLIFVVPFFGALVYLIARPRITDATATPKGTQGASSYASSNPVPGGRDSMHMG
jgi:hypothetical protein